MNIDKLDAAERQIVGAIQLLFSGGDPVPVYTLAAAARELTTTLCEKRGLPSLIDAIHEEHPHMDRRDVIRWAHQHAGFFKHADRDHDGKLEGFEPSHGDDILYIAVRDLGRLRGSKPIEADAFELWFYATKDLLEAIIGGNIEELRGLASKPRPEQLTIGKRFVEAARLDAPASGGDPT